MNPLLSRKQAPQTAETRTSFPEKTSTRFGGTSTVTFADGVRDDSSDFGLRQRRNGTPAPKSTFQKENRCNALSMDSDMSMLPPPKASLSMMPSGAYTNDPTQETPPMVGSAIKNTDATFSVESKQHTPSAKSSLLPYEIPSGGDYGNWVVVYGPCTSAQFQTVVRRFGSYGTILTTRGGSGEKANWIALHYDSRLQAEKALCQHNTFLEDNILIGVTRATPTLARQLGFSGVDTSISKGIATPSSLFKSPNVTHMQSKETSGDSHMELDEDDVLLGGREHPRTQGNASGATGTTNGRSTGPCQKVLSWVFQW